MYIMSSPVSILSGICWIKDEEFQVGSTSLKDFLEPYLDKKVTLSAHNWPDDLQQICYCGPVCQRPYVNWKSTGITQELKIPKQDLLGHHTRFLLVEEDFEVPDISGGLEDLSKLLEGLESTLKEIR